MKNQKPLKYVIAISAIIIYSSSSFAQLRSLTLPAEKMNYQAIVRDAGGNQLANQNVRVRFTIHTTTAGGATVYQENQILTTNQYGLVSTFIGTGTVTSGTFTGINWSGNNKFLQVEIDPAGGTSYTDMGTTQLVTVPYAFFSTEAATSDDNSWTQNATNIYNNNSGSVGIGINIPVNKLHVEDAGTPDGQGIIYANNTSATGTSDAVGVVGNSSTADWYGTGGKFIGGYEGVLGYVTPSGNHNYIGVAGNVVGGTGTNTGVIGVSDQVGVDGVSNGTGVPLTSYYGPSFLETAGVYGTSSNSTAVNGFSYGTIGEAQSASSHINCGVYGYGANASAGTTPRNYGVFGLCDDSLGGVGVFGLGDCQGSTHAMEADAIGGTTQIALFSYIATPAPANYAGYFSGQIYATAANAGIKAFKIDHPLDPANKFLYHSSVESPDMLNVYSGNVVTDANGYAKIELPSYFEALNKDFTYQLTCIGTFAQAIVAEKEKNNSFAIRTDKPGVEVSWMVTGIRHDQVAEHYRIVPEVEKTPAEKGKYLIPEAYGQPGSAAINLPSYPEKGVAKYEIQKPRDNKKN